MDREHASAAFRSRRSADHLRAAYQATATAPPAAMRAYGQRLPASARRHHVTTIHTALPHLADRLQAEPGWDALAAVLDQAERAGHDTTALLAKAAAQRQLDSADSISDVLVWRLQHLGYVTPPASAPRPQRPRAAPSPVPAAAVIAHQAENRPRRR
ncbi:hypothetical protein DDE74_13825 [Streptomyces lydicus]|uniref:Uncharacterized protein n=1 Tax=Streptomyces lydicus TaxID=47763 RepID=A0A3Q9K9U8_9ACTN|nr:hypothetical protein [Streptomyces lydicus]AZS71883.1 hypothetical protein DDE74_13825 [Streptomyces lydicus]